MKIYARITVIMVLFTICIRAWNADVLKDSVKISVPSHLTMDFVVWASLHANYALRADSLDISLKRAALEQVLLFENPELSFGSENVTVSQGSIPGESEMFVQLDQPFHPTLLKKRSMVAQHELTISEITYNLQKNNLRALSKTRFIDALSVQQIVALTDSLVHIALHAHRASGILAGAGKVSYSDTLKTAAELALAQIRLGNSQQLVTQAYLDLALLWNSNETPFVCNGTYFDTVPKLPDTSYLLQEIDSSFESQLQTVEIEKHKSLIAVENSKLFPQSIFGLGFGSTIDRSNMYGRLTVSFPLPLFDRNQHMRQSARVLLKQAEYKRISSHTTLRTEICKNYTKASSLLQTATLLRMNVLPKLNQSIHSSLTAYQSGKISIISLIDAQRNYFEISVQFQETVTQYVQTLIEIERLTGRKDLLYSTSYKE